MADGDLVTLPQGVPDRTLGWAVIRWMGKYLRHANGPRAGLPFRVTDSQALFLLHFYSLTDEGRWVYDRAARRWPKGSGKARSQPLTPSPSSSAPCAWPGLTRTHPAAA